MPFIFINYRAQEQAGYAALLDRELTDRFGARAVFRASRSIRPGVDFAQAILKNLRACRVLLAVIGPSWFAYGASGRGNDVGGAIDWVYQEIAEAFAASVRVVPVLVEDARMPAEADLPADIAPLARCQYVRLHHRTIEGDLGRLVDELRRLVPELRSRGRGDAPVERRHRDLYQLFGFPDRRIGVITGSIRDVRGVDAWVNSENTEMEMARFSEFSVSAIIRYHGAYRDDAGQVIEDVVGDGLATQIRGRRPVAPCTTFVTGSGSLAETHGVRYVIHVAAVHGEPGSGFRQVQQIGRCVTNALAAADRLASAEPVRSILFPLLGTGVAGAPVEPTVGALLNAAVEYLAATPDTTLETVYFLAYTDAEFEVLDDVVTSMPALAPIESSTHR